MRAARYYGNKDIRIEEIDEPTAGAGEVLIDVAFCGICGTDLHEYLDGPIFCPTPDTPTSWTGETAPVTLGHELSGVVAALGEGITDLEVGDTVVVEPYILKDGTDTGPDSTDYHLSEGMNFIGLGGGGGGLAEKLSVPAGSTRSIPASRWTRPRSSSRSPSPITEYGAPARRPVTSP